jgi:hypothetical protein
MTDPAVIGEQNRKKAVGDLTAKCKDVMRSGTPLKGR